ncbi:hypothetical protein PIB30_082429 [Stylosanthes scabra]|uniref:Uncharacterized protein n=1 Tax=Stylosanthes scabra TaxID=79078 RepID=A0ABU6VQT5_9FABA|nr:hypothetical protein [Stylosanthes scabra]
MESLETGPCLWVVTDQNIFGFRVGKLEQLGKNGVWHSNSNLSQLPFDFHLNLPDRNMHPFFFDSKLFFAGGSLDSSPLSSNKIHQLSYAGGATLDIAEVEPAAGTIPEPPTLLYNCYVTNIQGEVHLMVHDALTHHDREMGFWVLRSKQWHLLPHPPTLSNYDAKAAEVPKRKSVRYRFWHNGYNPAIVAVPSLGNVGNCNVALAWTTEAYPHEYLKLSIHALLVDNDDNCVRRQCLDELSEMIPSYFVEPNSLNVNFVDLGEGKVRVLLGGDIADYEKAKANAVLCVLVVKLGLVQEEAERFLSVDLLVNQVYDMMPYAEEDLSEVPQSSFVFSVSKGMPFKHPHSQGNFC